MPRKKLSGRERKREKEKVKKVMKKISMDSKRDWKLNIERHR